MSPAAKVITASFLALSAVSRGALIDNFDSGSFPASGSGWAGNWGNSSGSSLVSPTVTSASPLNGGGSYLSVSTAVANTTLGIRRDLGSTAASPYTLTFDWRLDSNDANFTSYTDRIHIGATSGSAATDYGSGPAWTWFIGVVGGDDPSTDTTLGTADDVPFTDKKWYFYDNTSTSANGSFTTANMKVSDITLTTGVTYSFTVTVDPANQKYSASMTDGTNSYSQTNMDFRQQSAAGTTATNLVFGASTSSTGDALTWSVDSINIVPEPSSALLLAAGGLLCLRRRRIAH